MSDPGPAGAGEAENVVLLHGLSRTPRSLRRMERRLADAGYNTVNLPYPSHRNRIETLVSEHLLPALRKCFGDHPRPVHFVTHSMGGILVRQLAAAGAPVRLGRVVMLAPPNGGSEVVDVLARLRLSWLPGRPSRSQLGSGPGSLPNRLGAAPFELGVIAGDRSVNWLLSLAIRGSNDGKVSVANARLDGMADFLVLPSSHPFIMRDAGAIDQTLHFLAHGRFRRT